MNKLVKFLLLAIPVFGIGVYLAYRDYLAPERFAVDGVVISINWHSRNHGMPRIEIESTAGTAKVFSNNRIALSANELKVGDRFVKSKGSKVCDINGKTVQCVK